MDQIQRILIKAGRKDLAQEYYLKMAAKNFAAWLKNKKFINLDTKKQSDFESLPEKQQRRIKEKYQEYLDAEKQRRKPQKEKPWTEAKVKQQARQISKDLKDTFGKATDDTAYEAAKNTIAMEPGLVLYFQNKGVKQQSMAEAFADYIP